VTLKDIISANPGISMPEAVMKLNSYNSAIARGENPPPLYGQTVLGSTQAATLGEGGALTKSQREIYVGNLPPGLAVPQLSEFLNAAMKQIGVGKDQGSVVTAWISPDAHYAFVEFRTVEEANAALNHLNGIQVGNYSLRFGRTKGYAGSVNTENSVNSSHLSSLSTLASGLLHPVSSAPTVTAVPSIIAEPLSDVIMVTNIPPVLDEQQVKDLFTPFGELKVFNIIKTVGNQGQSAVFEYVQSSIADAVVSGMNNLDVIGQKLSVQKVPQSSAIVLLKPIKSVAVEKKVENLECSDGAKATTVLRLSNMVTAEDLADDELYSELIEDVADECNQHGTVLSVIIPRNSNDTNDEAGVGKIFVQLSDLEGAKRVRKAVSGRKFNGRIVEAEYFAEELFQKQVCAMVMVINCFEGFHSFYRSIQFPPSMSPRREFLQQRGSISIKLYLCVNVNFLSNPLTVRNF